MKVKLTKEEVEYLCEVLDFIDITVVQNGLREAGASDEILKMGTLGLWKKLKGKLNNGDT